MPIISPSIMPPTTPPDINHGGRPNVFKYRPRGVSVIMSQQPPDEPVDPPTPTPAAPAGGGPAPATQYSNADAMALIRKSEAIFEMAYKLRRRSKQIGGILDVRTPPRREPDPNNPDVLIDIPASTSPPIQFGAPMTEEYRLRCFNHCRGEIYSILEEIKDFEIE